MIIAATALNAAIIYSLHDNKDIMIYWPGEYKKVRDKLGISKIIIDKSIDNRLNFLDLKNTSKEGHLHLNAVDYNGEKYYALFHKFGAICDLENKSIILKHQYLEGAHNLKFINEKQAYILSTRYGFLLEVDIEKKSIFPLIDLNNNIFSKKIKNIVKIKTKLQNLFGFKKNKKIAKILFWRGLAITDRYFFIGTSPAAILCFDRVTLKLIDYFQYSQDVRDAVHGLFIEE